MDGQRQIGGLGGRDKGRVVALLEPKSKVFSAVDRGPMVKQVYFYLVHMWERGIESRVIRPSIN